MPDGPLRVAVTGAAGYLGGRLIQRLQDCDSVSYILATDIQARSENRVERSERDWRGLTPRSSPLTPHNRVEFARLDITEPFPDLFARYDINAVVHLAYKLNPGRRPDLARRVNVTGTDHVIQACANSDVSHVVYLSSTSVYGAHPDNPDFLTEDDPVRPIPGFQYSEDKAAAESRLTEFAERSSTTAVTILRGCPVMGPHADNFIANAFRKPALPRLGDADPPMQFIHEDDLTEVIIKCLEAGPSGTYNVAGDGTIRWSRMAAVMGRRTLRLPPAAWRALTSAAWSLGLQSDSPACGLDFIRYRWTASADKLKRELGVSPKHTSSEAWESFARQSSVRL